MKLVDIFLKKLDYLYGKIKSFYLSNHSTEDPDFTTQILYGTTELKKKYFCFKKVLMENEKILDLMSEIVQNRERFCDKSYYVFQIESLLSHTLSFIDSLNEFSDRKYTWLYEIYQNIAKNIRKDLNLIEKTYSPKLIYFLENISKESIHEIGAKAANLAEVKNVLHLPVPEGLVISSSAFQKIIYKNDLDNFIKKRLDNLNIEDKEKISTISKEIKQAILNSRLPKEFSDKLTDALNKIGSEYWSVRSSALGEDGEYSFAGQFFSKLNVPLSDVPRAYLEVLASLYEERAIYYRLAKGLNLHKMSMPVLILEMINARSSGVIYTANPISSSKEEMLISAHWGIGKPVVGGDNLPDIFVLDRHTGNIKEQKIASKSKKLVTDKKNGLKEEEIPISLQKEPSLNPDEILKLYQMAITIEEYYQSPQDIEWCIDENGNIYILQTRPLKTLSIKAKRANSPKFLLCKGDPVSPGVACGTIFWLEDLKDIKSLPQQAIVVTKNMDPSLVTIVHHIKGLISLRGSSLSHLATILREFNIPAIICPSLTPEEIPNGKLVTLDAINGNLYLGRRENILEIQISPKFPKKKRDSQIEKVLEYIIPLNLAEIPEDGKIFPEQIKSIHDLVRFGHEILIKEMFLWGEKDYSRMAHILFSSRVPIVFYVVDIEGGLKPHVAFKKKITIEDVCSIPFLAFWEGMSHPDVRWAGNVPFELQSFISIVSRSFVRDRDLFGKAYVLISREYFNFHCKLAYHFAVVDSYCSEDNMASNYIAFSFQGGAANLEGRLGRLLVIKKILSHFGFKINIKADRLKAILRGTTKKETEQILNQIGRLMAYVRQLDMSVNSDHLVDKYAKAFLEGNYSVVHE